ncbi:MAG: GAF domain-containing protein, partial [Deltaproteobacteria bacterium]|nr:GAF domain-containing protein [Deltaproteobacteria bacterium]
LSSEQHRMERDCTKNIQGILEIVAEALETERVSFWTVIKDFQGIECTDLYTLSTGKHAFESVIIAEDEHPKYLRAIKMGEPLAAHDARNDLRTAEFRDNYLAPLGITSMLDMAVKTGGRIIGIICMEHVGDPREWAIDEIAFASFVSNQIASSYMYMKQMQAETEQNRANLLLMAINDAQSGFISQSLSITQSKAMFDHLLQDLLKMTEGEYGFIGEVFRTKEGKPYLKTRAVTNIAWDAASRKFYEEHSENGLEFRNLQNLLGHVMTTGEAVIANDPANDPRSGELPEGHPPLNAFMGIPIKKGRQMIGMVGVSNRKGGFDEDLVEYLEPLLTTIAAIMDRYAKDVELLETQERVTRVAAELRQFVDTANAPIFGVDTDGNINEWNQMVARITGYGKDEVSGKNLVKEYITEEYKASVKEVLDNALKGEETDNYEVPIFTKDGERIMVLLNATTRRDAEGNIVGVVGVGQDITELSKHRENLESLVETRTTELKKALSDTEHAKEELSQSKESLVVRNEIAEVFLTGSNDSMYGDILKIILKIVKSKYGFFGYINDDGDMVAPSMIGDMMELCKIPGKSYAFPKKDWAGIWGKSLIEKKSIYVNEGLHLPEGHFPLTRGMTVPIIFQEDIYGILAVADKKTDYDENDKKSLEAIASHIAPILRARLQRNTEEMARIKAEKQLQESLVDTENARDRVDGILKSVADGLIVTD